MRVLFMGSKQWGLNILREIYSLSPETLGAVLTIEDTNDARSVFPDFKKFSDQCGLKLCVAKSKTQAEQIIQELKPELCFVAGWYWLISPSVLSSVPHGFIGIHPSLLPKYRGGAPLIWAIINNEKHVGFSLFSLSNGIDDGPIWAQGSVEVKETDYISDIQNKLDGKIAEVLRDKYLHILNGTARPMEQNHALASYCAIRSRGDGNIGWHKSAKEIYDFIRAQSDPYPGALTNFQGKLMIIRRAKLFESPYYGTPGQVARIASDGVYIICGDHRAIIVEEVELEGKRGKASNFIKSIKCKMSDYDGEI